MIIQNASQGCTPEHGHFILHLPLFFANEIGFRLPDIQLAQNTVVGEDNSNNAWYTPSGLLPTSKTTHRDLYLYTVGNYCPGGELSGYVYKSNQ